MPSVEGPRQGPGLPGALLRPEVQSSPSEPLQEGARDEGAEVAWQEGMDRAEGGLGSWPQPRLSIRGCTSPQGETAACRGESRARLSERGPEGLPCACGALEPRAGREQCGPTMLPLHCAVLTLAPGVVGCTGERGGRGGRPDMARKAARTARTGVAGQHRKPHKVTDAIIMLAWCCHGCRHNLAHNSARSQAHALR